MSQVQILAEDKPGVLNTRQTVFIKTFGCLMNEYDSEKIFSLLSETHSPVSTPEEADLVLINTCSVREKGEHKLFSLLGRMQQLKDKNRSLIVGVGGCVAQQEGRDLIKRSPVVDFVVGTHNLSLIPSMVDNLKSSRSKQVAVDYRDEWEELPEAFDSFRPENLPAGSSQSAFYSPVRAMVAIQRGCNKNCAFCVVPTTRGPEVSRDLLEIERELKHKVALGAKEVMLLGQTVNSWGRDLKQRSSFEYLVERLSEIEGLERIRFTSPHPADVRPEFIKLYQNNKKLCPSIHMPLQSGSNRILRLMNRNYRKERYLDIISELRETLPKISISTDIIVGFPTESEEEFLESLQMVRDVRYSMIYCFVYSKRPNTVAGDIYSDESLVPLEIAKGRLYRLQDEFGRIALELNREFVGRSSRVLIEEVSVRDSDDDKKVTVARGRNPENVLVEILVNNGLSGENGKSNCNGELKVGSFLEVEICTATAFGLGAKVYSEAC